MNKVNKCHEITSCKHSSVEYGITRYFDPDRLRHDCSQDTDLSYHVPNSTFFAICDRSLPKIDRQTDREMDGRTDERRARHIWHVMLKSLT